MIINDNSPASLRAFLSEHELAVKKRFGQNFMCDSASRRRVVAACGVAPGSSVWEIGPGLGALTAELLAAGAVVTGFEIDHGFARVLRERFSGCNRFRLVTGDAAETVANQVESEGAPACLVGNLPYRSGASILIDLFALEPTIPRVVATLQAEAIDRLAADVGEPAYGAPAILRSAGYRVIERFAIARGCFYPVPRVDSSVLVLEALPAAERLAADRVCRLTTIVRIAFAAPRKTLRNNLVACGRWPSETVERILGENGIHGERPQRVDTQTYIRLADELPDAEEPARAVVMPVVMPTEEEIGTPVT